MNTKEKAKTNSTHVRLNKFILRCPFCKRGFSRRADLDKHKLCVNLTKRTDVNNNVQQQEEKHQSWKSDSFSCPTCGEIFYRWSVFCRHTSFHTYLSVVEESNLKNVYNGCKPDLEYPTGSSQKQEIVGFNKDNLVEVKGNMSHRTEKKLKAHCKSKQRSYSLSIKKRAVKKRLCRHQCKICRRIFKHSTNLIVHMRVHSNDRPYKCKFCSCKFKQRCHLNNHERLHSGELPWECTLCGQRFRQKANLDYHINKHH